MRGRVAGDEDDTSDGLDAIGSDRIIQNNRPQA